MTPPPRHAARNTTRPGSLGIGAKTRAVEILQKLPLFAGMLEGEFYRILSVCSSLTLGEGEVLFREGEAGKDLFVLLSGEIGVVLEGRGTIHVMHAGEVLGEVCLVSDFRRTASAVARAESALLRMETRAVRDLFERNPRMGMVTMRNIARTLAQRLRDENEKQKFDLDSLSR